MRIREVRDTSESFKYIADVEFRRILVLNHEFCQIAKVGPVQRQQNCYGKTHPSHLMTPKMTIEIVNEPTSIISSRLHALETKTHETNQQDSGLQLPISNCIHTLYTTLLPSE
jgi:hypothetical protein